MSTQSEALKKFFYKNGIKGRDIAQALGLQPCTVSNILNGQKNIGPKVAAKLHEVYGFSVPFLIMGEGDLFNNNNDCQVVERSTISGSAVQSPGATVHAEADAALIAENERLRDEVRFLRSLLMKQE